VARAIVCPSCGAKVRAGREKCPRCRADLSAAPAAPRVRLERGMQIAVAVFLGVAALTAVLLWRNSGEASTAVAATPAARARRSQPAEAAPPPPSTNVAGVAIPFLDDRRGGSLAYAGGNYDEALAHYLEALRRNPDDSETLSNMGQVFVRLNRTEEALPFFEQAIKLAPQRWAYHFNLARAQGLLGRWGQAVAEYQTARGLFPNDYVTEFNLGLALHNQGNEAAAVEAYQRAIALEPTDASFHLALGLSYERLQKPAEAAAAYGRYLELAPDAAEAGAVKARIVQLASGPQAAAPPAPAR
jgi:tetratricopeptide (TPR) repeat protein